FHGTMKDSSSIRAISSTCSERAASTREEAARGSRSATLLLGGARARIDGAGGRAGQRSRRPLHRQGQSAGDESRGRPGPAHAREGGTRRPVKGRGPEETGGVSQGGGGSRASSGRRPTPSSRSSRACRSDGNLWSKTPRGVATDTAGWGLAVSRARTFEPPGV